VNASRSAWLADARMGAAVFLFTLLPVYAGVYIGATSGLIEHRALVEGFLHGFCHFDGGHFESIIHNGYEYDPGRGSNIAFFPGYPLAIESVKRLTGWPTRLAMVVVSNAALCCAFVLLARYLRLRRTDEPPRLQLLTLLLIGLWPVGFFFRMGYSESLFLAFLALLLLGVVERWPAAVLAVIAGALTGIRPVGVAASAAVIAHVLLDPARGPFRGRLLSAAWLAPLSCWGLLAFMGYQQARFGTPLAFVVVQKHWAYHTPDPGAIPTKAARLALAEPIWNTYVPGSSRHWVQYGESQLPFPGLGFWNPILFLVAVAAVVGGWVRGWLSRFEAILGIGLLLIPYVTRADEMSMGSHARFAAVVIPAYLVLARILGRLPAPVVWIVYASLAVSLILWSALFAAHWALC
jgi:hypothetical protein